jgi:hypothetical protein
MSRGILPTPGTFLCTSRFREVRMQRKEFSMKTFSKITFAALVGGCALAMTASSASARIVCNEDGDCWHAKTDYAYHPEFGLTVHPDDWKWKEGEKHAWREHEGKGYWKGGSWKEF